MSEARRASPLERQWVLEGGEPIHWLLCDAAEVPGMEPQSAGRPSPRGASARCDAAEVPGLEPPSAVRSPPHWLGPREREIFARLRSDKRRRDWLLGRFAAKKLLARYLGDLDGQRHRLEEIEILANEAGAPVVALAPAAGTSLSLSHAGARAFAAVSRRRLGVDLEPVAARPRSLLADFFTSREQWEAETAAEPAILATAIWCAKEAALKSLGLGLALDTRDIECRPLSFPAAGAWGAFEMHLAAPRGQEHEGLRRFEGIRRLEGLRRVVGRGLVPRRALSGRLEGHWRIEDGYLLACVVAGASLDGPAIWPEAADVGGSRS